MKDTDLNTTRTSLSDLATAEQRIAAWSTWFNVPAPTLKHEDGDILLTDELYEWILSSNASFDWLFLGDPHGMAAAFKREEERTRPMRQLLAKFDNVEQEIIVNKFEALNGGSLTFDAAMAEMKAEIDAHRRQNTAGA